MIIIDLMKNGALSSIVRLDLYQDNAAANPGQGLTGITNVTSGLILSVMASTEAVPTLYTVAASNVETIATLGAFVEPTASKIRIKEVDPTNAPGRYELQIADAKFAISGARYIDISILGVTDLLEFDGRVFLDLDDADAIRDSILTRMGGLVATVDDADFSPTTTSFESKTASLIDFSDDKFRGAVGWFLTGPAANQGFFVTASSTPAAGRVLFAIERGKENNDKLELGQAFTDAPLDANQFVILPNV